MMAFLLTSRRRHRLLRHTQALLFTATFRILATSCSTTLSVPIADKSPLFLCLYIAFLLILFPACTSHTCCKTQKLCRVILCPYFIIPPRTVTVRYQMFRRPDLIRLNAQIKTIFTQRDWDIWKYDKRTAKDKNWFITLPWIFAPFAVRVNQLAIEYRKL